MLSVLFWRRGGTLARFRKDILKSDEGLGIRAAPGLGAVITMLFWLTLDPTKMRVANMLLAVVLA
jgi:hypothetical protein